MDETLPIWLNGSEEELVKKLLGGGFPSFLQPEEEKAGHEFTTSSNFSDEEEAIKRLISTVYSGPTISDIENALSVTPHKDQSRDLSHARVSLLGRSLSKIEHKYTLKIKSLGNCMADDGYKWRKYGQKSIKNSPYPRSYYRCTNPRCSAKKQVERSIEDPETLVITYEGLHLHFAYPFFLLSQAQEAINPPAKKPKTTNISPAQVQECEALDTQNVSETQMMEAQESPKDVISGSPMSSKFVDFQMDMAQDGLGQQGLLEDVVPLMIRNPSTDIAYSNSSGSSYPSHPASPSSLSWSSYSNSFYSIGLNSSIS